MESRSRGRGVVKARFAMRLGCSFAKGLRAYQISLGMKRSWVSSERSASARRMGRRMSSGRRYWAAPARASRTREDGSLLARLRRASEWGRVCSPT